MRIQPSREDLIELTRLNLFERFPDGRPRVPDDLLERMKLVTTEEAWSVLRNHGYHRQFEGNWMQTHLGTITVGRAVTAQFLPHRPDYHDAVQATGLGEGRGQIGGQNSWIIETLQANDVMVVDIFGKVKDGTVVGDNFTDVPFWNDFIDGVPKPIIQGGYIRVPEAPGMGFEINADAIEQHLVADDRDFFEPTPQWDAERSGDRLWS